MLCEQLRGWWVSRCTVGEKTRRRNAPWENARANLRNRCARYEIEMLCSRDGPRHILVAGKLLTVCHGRKQGAGIRRAAGLACAAAYLFSGTETLPQLLALGAWLEGFHTVHVGRSQGQISAVLSHERGVPGGPDRTPRHPAETRLHRHGLGARIFCLFTDRTAPKADHVASFAAASACERPAGASKMKLQAGLTRMPAALVNLAAIPAAPEVSSFARTTLAVPRPADSLRCLRSTILVL